MDDQYIESAALADLHAAADTDLRSELGMQDVKLDGAYLSCARNISEAAFKINRTIGLGDEAVANSEHIEAVKSFYKNAGVEKYLLHINPHISSSFVIELVEKYGFRKSRGWMKFARETELPPEVNTKLNVQIIGQEHAIEFGQIVSKCFNLGDKAIPWLAKLPGRDPWHIYMGFSDGHPIGAGAMFIQKKNAWLDWCATLPEYRGKGCQLSILRMGIIDAIKDGCVEIMTCNDEAIHAEPQHSYSNMLKMGFRERYIRENYQLAI